MRLQITIILFIIALVSASRLSPPVANAIPLPLVPETHIEKRHGPGGDDDGASTTAIDYSTATYTVLKANGTPITTVTSSGSSTSMTLDDQGAEPAMTSGSRPDLSTDSEPTSTPDSASTSDDKTMDSAPESPASPSAPENQASEPTTISDPVLAPELSASPTNMDSQEYKPTTTSDPSPGSEKTPEATSE